MSTQIFETRVFRIRSRSVTHPKRQDTDTVMKKRKKRRIRERHNEKYKSFEGKENKLGGREDS
jgi:hypothetical protein